MSSQHDQNDPSVTASTGGGCRGRQIGRASAWSDDVGLRLIVGYKLAKATAELLIGLALLVDSSMLTHQLQLLAGNVREHTAEAWSVALAEQFVHAATQRHLLVGGVAACLDGALTFAEAWALHSRYRWARWLVIGTTSCLLPMEVIAVVRHASLFRVVLLSVNVLIVINLVCRRGRDDPGQLDGRSPS